MRKTIIAVAAAGTIAGAAYLFAGPSATAEEVTLYKNPQCGCCENYADYLRDNGFTVTVKPTHELAPMSREAGIPDDFQGCHLAFIDDYVVSGHVPVGTVNRLLTERPDIKGVTLPGMPMGSPGMSGTKTEPFTVYEINDGRPKVYAVE
jgi:hypothetical protein